MEFDGSLPDLTPYRGVPNKIADLIAKKKMDAAKARDVAHMLSAGFNTPFWKFLAEQLKDRRDACQTHLNRLPPKEENLGIMAQLQAELKVYDVLLQTENQAQMAVALHQKKDGSDGLEV